MMSLHFRCASPADASALAPLMLAAEPDLLPWLYDSPRLSTQDFLTRICAAGKGYFGWQHQVLATATPLQGDKSEFSALARGEVLCCATAYRGSSYARLMRETVLFTLGNYRLSQGLGQILPKAMRLGPIYSMPAPDSLYLGQIAVRADLRGQGIGVRLMAQLHAHGLSMGCTRAELDVSLANPRAQAFYERLGYRVRAEHSLKQGPIPGLRRMERPLRD